MSAIDWSTEAGQRAERRLREDRTIWLGTVAADGTPSIRPVWFVWDGETVLVYSEPEQAKVRHIEQNPRVLLHFDADAFGEDVVILTGRARIAREEPPVDQVDAYVEKYGWGFERLGMTPAEYARDYSVPIRVTPERLRAY